MAINLSARLASAAYKWGHISNINVDSTETFLNYPTCIWRYQFISYTYPMWNRHKQNIMSVVSARSQNNLQVCTNSSRLYWTTSFILRKWFRSIQIIWDILLVLRYYFLDRILPNKHILSFCVTNLMRCILSCWSFVFVLRHAIT